MFSEVLGDHYHASNNFSEVPLLYDPKKYKRYLSGICHINSFNENVVLSQLSDFLLTLKTCKSVCYVSVVAISRVQMIHSDLVIDQDIVFWYLIHVERR